MTANMLWLIAGGFWIAGSVVQFWARQPVMAALHASTGLMNIAVGYIQ